MLKLQSGPSVVTDYCCHAKSSAWETSNNMCVTHLIRRSCITISPLPGERLDAVSFPTYHQHVQLIFNQFYSSKIFRQHHLKTRNTHKHTSNNSKKSIQYKQSTSSIHYCTIHYWDWQTLHNKLSSKLHFHINLFIYSVRYICVVCPNSTRGTR